MTEEEQLESIKKWWNRHGTLVTVGLSIVLVCIAGYRYYDWHQYKMKQQASITYEKMMMEFSNHNNKAVRAYANDLISNYDNSVYADVAHMTLAKIYVSKDKLDKAKNELQQVVNSTKMAPLKQIAKIRIARILAADKSYTNALQELSSIEDATYLPVSMNLKETFTALLDNIKKR
jgi:predicted negative regulator of RcsB-dependent stress response